MLELRRESQVGRISCGWTEKLPSRSCNRAATALCAAGVVLSPPAALAGAWTLPRGEGQVIATLFGWAGAGAPYGGQGAPRESKIGSQFYLEYGLAEALTVVGEVSAERYVLTPPSRDSYLGFDYSGAGLRARVWSNDAW